MGSPLRPQELHTRLRCVVPWYPAGRGPLWLGLRVTGKGAACLHAGVPTVPPARGRALHGSASCHCAAPQGMGTHDRAGWVAGNPLGDPGRRMWSCKAGNPAPHCSACNPPGWSSWPLLECTAPSAPAPAPSGTRTAAPSTAPPATQGKTRSVAAPPFPGAQYFFFPLFLPSESVNFSICSSPPAHTQALLHCTGIRSPSRLPPLLPPIPRLCPSHQRQAGTDRAPNSSASRNSSWLQLNNCPPSHPNLPPLLPGSFRK